MEMLEFFRSFDECVGDACQFLGVERPEFFDMAAQWMKHAENFSSFANPEQYYRSFVGDVGRSNLCSNIIDQFTRVDVANILPRLPNSSVEGRPLSFADVGCGTAALSFSESARYGKAYLIDLPNLAQEFIIWRIKKHNRTNIWTGILEDVQARIDVMICVDVLEHIANSSDFFRMMHVRLSRGGLLLLRIPWRSVVQHPEHLAEAESNWQEGGGAELLKTNYDLLAPFSLGGLYRRKIEFVEENGKANP